MTTMETVHSRLVGREYFLNRDTLRIDLEEATGMSEIPDFVREIVWDEAVNDLRHNTAISQACEIISNYEKAARLVLLVVQAMRA